MNDDVAPLNPSSTARLSSVRPIHAITLLHARDVQTHQRCADSTTSDPLTLYRRRLHWPVMGGLVHQGGEGKECPCHRSIKYNNRPINGPCTVESSAVAEMGDRGHSRHGPKRAGRLLCPFRGGAGSPSNTKSSGPRHTSTPSGILVHPAVWPQWTSAENGVCAPLEEGSSELGPHLTQYRLG